MSPNQDAGGGGGGDEDAGTDLDSGVEMDGGVDADAGMETDAGADSDAGMETDAGFDGGITPQNLCDDIATKKCDFFIRCRTDDDPDNDPKNQGRVNAQWVASERAECEAIEKAECEVARAGWELGRTSLDQAAYLACIDGLFPAGTCLRDLNGLITTCIPLRGKIPYIAPQSQSGDLCVGDFECQDGYCSKPNQNTCGTCTTYIANNQGCTRSEECDPATSWCERGFIGASNDCEGYRNIGQSCSGLGIGFPDIQCGPGNVCVRTGQFTAECAAGKLQGDSCQGGAMECLRSGGPFPELICSQSSGTGTCVQIMAVSGGVCGTGELGGPICPETEFCAAGLCTPRRVAGMACQGDDNCVYGTRCVTNICTAYKDVGDACNNDDECQNPLTCQGATCESTVASLGEPCNQNVPCVDSYCDGSTNMCTARKPNGQACMNANECESTACVMGMCAAACWQ